jgi:hypothetical protein
MFYRSGWLRCVGLKLCIVLAFERLEDYLCLSIWWLLGLALDGLSSRGVCVLDKYVELLSLGVLRLCLSLCSVLGCWR